MKKTIFISIMIFAALVLSVSCSNSGKTPKNDSYTVTFDLKGGKCEGLDTKQTVKAGDTVDEPVSSFPTAPDAKYYIFDEWQDKNGEKYDFSKPVTSDITIYAYYKPKYGIGQSTGSGIVFYENKNYVQGSSDSDKNWKYLEVAKEDFKAIVGNIDSDKLAWGSSGAVETSTSAGKGYSNTKIIAESSLTSAIAKEVWEKTWNGLSDWFIPSKDELVEIYKNYEKIKDAKISSADYWTSSGDGNDNAWCLKFDGGTTPTPQSVSRSTECRVRLIRKF